MPVVKVIELVGQSKVSWQDAVEQAVKEAAKTVRHITGVEVLNWTGDIENGEIVDYKADVQIAFVDRLPEGRIGIDEPRREVDLAKTRPDQSALLDGEHALGAVLETRAVEIKLDLLEAHRLQGDAQLQRFEAAQRRCQDEALDACPRAAHIG